jgi:hypothetical protein
MINKKDNTTIHIQLNVYKLFEAMLYASLSITLYLKLLVQVYHKPAKKRAVVVDAL